MGDEGSVWTLAPASVEAKPKSELLVLLLVENNRPQPMAADIVSVAPSAPATEPHCCSGWALGEGMRCGEIARHLSGPMARAA